MWVKVVILYAAAPPPPSQSPFLSEGYHGLTPKERKRVITGRRREGRKEAWEEDYKRKEEKDNGETPSLF